MFKKVFLIILIIVISLNIVIANNSQESDPLVTLSYLEKRINELREYIDYNKSKTPNEFNKYKVIKVDEGSKVFFEQESLEFILRSGKASAIANESGDGLSDLTVGKDLKTGDLIQKNHLILIPRNDSRGLNALTDIWIMVKGKYRVENE